MVSCHIQIEYAGAVILSRTDKAKPEVIKNDFNMSKNEFKRGIGRLLKERKVSIGVNSIKLTKE